MTLQGGKTRLGSSPTLRASPRGDPRDRLVNRQGVARGELAPPLSMDVSGRVSLTLDPKSPLVRTPDGKLAVRVGGGLIVEVGSPSQLKLRTSDSIQVDALGTPHARPKASQVRNDSHAGGTTLAETIDKHLVRTDDARLSDARTPLAHTQAFSTLTGLPTTRAGYGITDAVGTNDKRIVQTSGAATLVGGVATVTTAAVTANSMIFLSNSGAAGTLGILAVSARTPGTSFVITSLNVLDTSVVSWMLLEP